MERLQSVSFVLVIMASMRVAAEFDLVVALLTCLLAGLFPFLSLVQTPGANFAHSGISVIGGNNLKLTRHCNRL